MGNEVDAVTLQQVEMALGTFLGGRTLSILGATPVAVPVFIDYPDPEVEPKRTFPSISVMWTDMEPEMELAESDTTYDEIDMSSIPYVFTTKKKPVWYRVTLQVHSWVLRDAVADRALDLDLETALEIRDVLAIDGDYYNIFRTGFQRNDTPEEDAVVYHKVWSYDVLVPLALDDIVSQGKTIHSIQLDSYSFRTRYKYSPDDTDDGRASGDWAWHPVDDSGTVVPADEAKRVPHRRVVFTETDVTIAER